MLSATCARVSGDACGMRPRAVSSSRKQHGVGTQQRARVGGHCRVGPEQDHGDARHVVALQVAPDERNVLAGLQLAEDGRVQRRIEFRETQRLRGGRHLEFVVEQTLRDVGPEQRTEHRPVNGQHLLVDGHIDRRHAAAEVARIVDVEVADRQPAQERGREPEAVGGEDRSGKQLERRALLVDRDRFERRAAAAGMVRTQRETADVLDRVCRALLDLEQPAREIPPQQRVRFVGSQRTRFRELPQLARELQLAVGVGQRIAAPGRTCSPADRVRCSRAYRRP